MSFIVEKKELSVDLKKIIKDKCNIWEQENQYSPFPKLITIFKVVDGKVIIPLAIWKDICEFYPNEYQQNGDDFDKIKTKFEFVGELLEEDQRDQITVFKESVELLEKNFSILLALRTGFGKTAMMFKLISHYRFKTVILSYSNKLHIQYVEQCNKWCPNLKIQIVKDDKLDPDYDVYIMGIIKATHFAREQFQGIGMVFVDEAHMILTETFSNALLQFSPKYLIGLSATPDKKNGKHELLFPFFGEEKFFIKRYQKKDFVVIKLNTNFKPKLIQNKQGILDWSTVVRSISSNLERQKLIVDFCLKYKDHKILILTKLVCTILGCENYKKCPCDHKKGEISKGLIPLLKEAGENNFDYCCDSKKTTDESKRIIIGTSGKLGVGYDSLCNLLILESSFSDVRQFEGRCRTHNNIIIDIVDDFATLKKHYQLREDWYLQRGAEIEEQYSSGSGRGNTFEKREVKHKRLI